MPPQGPRVPPHALPSTPRPSIHPMPFHPPCATPKTPCATPCPSIHPVPPLPIKATPRTPRHPTHPTLLHPLRATPRTPGQGTHPDTRGCCRSCSVGPVPGTPLEGGIPAGGAARPRRRRRCRAPTGTTRPTAPLLQHRGSNVGRGGTPRDVTSTALLAAPAPRVAPAPTPRGQRALGRSCAAPAGSPTPHRTAPRGTALHHAVPCSSMGQRPAAHGTARHCTAPHRMARHCTPPAGQHIVPHTALRASPPHATPHTLRHPVHPMPPCTHPTCHVPPGRAAGPTWAPLGGGAGPLALAVPGASPAPVLRCGVAAVPGGGLGAGTAAGGAAGPGPPRAPAPVHAAPGVGATPQRPGLTRAGG